MPKRTDIKTILIIGAGPIVIGQACEFDYSGTQACKALRDEGYRIVLLNSNPATIMTDPDMADSTYIEPITLESIEKIIAIEKPDALLPTMGGQTALNSAIDAAKAGILAKYNVELIGADIAAIEKAEDRSKFKQAMEKIGLDTPRSGIANNMQDADEIIKRIGLPVIIRPSFTLGGQGGGIAYNMEEYKAIVESGLDASPTTEVLIEESILGWKEYEMEVVRDKKDNCIIVCSIENVDPMGVHTGDSITVAPALTLTDKEYQIMRDASLAVLREIGVETGGSNVQFAVDPTNGRLIVIEMNPRVSRSSALASKATGFPIAKVAAKLAVGYTLDELKNDITKTTPASFEPTIDYIVTKIPRFTFEKFSGSVPLLGSSMKSVGETMAMGRNFHESLQKAFSSLEIGLNGLNSTGKYTEDTISKALSRATPERILIIADALRLGKSVEDICRLSKFDKWFVERVKEITDTEEQISEKGLANINKSQMLGYKKMGFSDSRIAELTNSPEANVKKIRNSFDIKPVFKRIDSVAAEFTSHTSYFYSCYEGDGISEADCEANISDKKKVVILGGGPNRIGQGIEFDYACCHASFAIKDAGLEAIMINCNPETVSTDYDTSDRLYFEPLTAENVLAIIEKESEKGEVLGVIVQLGGQTPLKLAHTLQKSGINILGTDLDSIDLAEDRERFRVLLDELEIKQPQSQTSNNEKDTLSIAEKLGYPVLVRPSYVLGGRAMQIVENTEGLEKYLNEMQKQFRGKLFENPLLVDRYLQGATEIDVDVMCDGTDVYVAGIMEHIEEAGIHSGDSACSLPPFSLSKETITTIKEHSTKLALKLKVSGFMNVQYAVKDGEVYVIEVNPRASRTVPFVAKAIGIPLVKYATNIMLGEKLNSFNLKNKNEGYIAVKEAVFPFARFPGVDVLLGPEMKSTGEVMGLDKDFGMAYAKAQIAANNNIPSDGKIFISVKDSDKDIAVEIAKNLNSMGYKIVATSGTAKAIKEHDIEVEEVNKVLEGRPHVVDSIKNGDIQLVINTTEGAIAIADSFSIRSTALNYKVPYTTTMAGALAMLKAMFACREKGGLEVRSLQTL